MGYLGFEFKINMKILNQFDRYSMFLLDSLNVEEGKIKSLEY